MIKKSLLKFDTKAFRIYFCDYLILNKHFQILQNIFFIYSSSISRGILPYITYRSLPKMKANAHTKNFKHRSGFIQPFFNQFLC